MTDSAPASKLGRATNFRADAAWTAGLVAAALAFHARLLLGALPLGRDAGRLFYPVQRFVHGCVRAGELPLWLPTDGGGTSLAALPVVALHPLVALHLVLGADAWFRLAHLAAVAGALVGAFGLSRALGAGRPAAALGAAAYALCGVFCSYLEFLPLALSAAAAPWALWGAIKAVDGSRAARLGTVAALGLVVLGGDLQLAPETMALVVLVGVVRGGARGGALTLGLAALGALAGGTQLVPALAVLGGSTRAAGFSDADAQTWSLAPARLAELLVAPAAPDPRELLGSIYLGPVPLLLAALGAAAKPRRTTLVLAAAAVLCGLAALGPAVGLYGLLRAAVPLWRSFRFPEKLLIPAMLCLSPLVALGAERLRARGAWLAPALLALVVGDLWRANRDVAPLADPSTLAPPPLARALAGQPGTVFTLGISERGATREALDARVDAALLPDRSLLYGIRSWNEYKWAIPRRVREVTAPGPWEGRLAGVFGVAHLVVELPVPERLREQVEAVDEAHELAAVRLRRVLPGAYVAGVALPVAPDDAVRRLLAPDFRPGRTVLIEGPVAVPTPEALAAAPPAVEARVVARRCSGLDVDAELATPGVVVVNEPFAPGWSATVDGAPAPLWPANALVRGVPAPAGRHRISLRYRAPGLASGAALSALALVAAVALSRRRRPATKVG